MRILHLAFNRNPLNSYLNQHLSCHHQVLTPATKFLTSFPNERLSDVMEDYVRILSAVNMFDPEVIIIEVDEAPENCVPGRNQFRVSAKDARFNGFIQLIVERYGTTPTIFILTDPTKWPACLNMEICNLPDARPTAILGAGDVDSNGWHVRYAGTQNWEMSTERADRDRRNEGREFRMSGLEGLLLSPTLSGADPGLSQKVWAQIHSGLPGARLGLPDPGFGTKAWEGWSGARKASWGLVVAYSEGWLSDRAGMFAREGIVPIPYEGPQLGCDNQFRMIPRYSLLRNPPPQPWSATEYEQLLAEAIELTTADFSLLDRCLQYIEGGGKLPDPQFGGFYDYV